MKTQGISRILKSIGLVALMTFSIPAFSQNSAPPPGAGGAFTPNNGPGIPGGPGGGPGGPGPNVYNPGPPPPSNWGGPWGSGWVSSPPIIVNTPLSSPNWQNSGVTNVVACGYDAQGVWRSIPLRVAYTYNGAQYVVNVLAAWNPWTDTWNRNIDVPAFNTSYFINGTTYDFYTNLSTGTFYFNL